MKGSCRKWHCGYDVQLPPVKLCIIPWRWPICSILLPWDWRVATMGEGGHASADSCRMGEVKNVGMVELVCWQTVEDGLWSFLNVCAWICWRWGNSMEAEWATMGTFWKPNFVTCSARIVSGWVVVAYSGLAENTFCMPGFENVSRGDGSDCQTRQKNTLL